MNSKQLGIITHLTIPAFIAMFYLGGPGPGHFLGELTVLLLLLGFISLVGYYCLLVSRNKALDATSKNKWYLGLFLFHWLAMLIYWYKYIKPDLRRA